MDKPKYRSFIRIKVGYLYYLFRKFYYWHFSTVDFAVDISNVNLPYPSANHSTPLYRQLQGVDMELQQNKVKNLEIALRKLDGLLIRPGQVFSYWKLIGQPTRLKGYKKGMVLDKGKFKAGVGGGLCQLSNLIYWMTLHTPLIIIERWRHSYDVFPDSGRVLPFGSGATCAYPAIDLQIKNNTLETFQLKLDIKDGLLRGGWLSSAPAKFRYEVYEKNHSFQPEWWGGYSRNNSIFRKTIDIKKSAVIEDKLITENHAIMMYEPLLNEPSM